MFLVGEFEDDCANVDVDSFFVLDLVAVSALFFRHLVHDFPLYFGEFGKFFGVEEADDSEFIVFFGVEGEHVGDIAFGSDFEFPVGFVERVGEEESGLFILVEENL